jgi:3D (Asp-Asp-Asp) domain-containing protein
MKKTKIAVAGLAISLSLLSVSALATAKARFGQMYPPETQQQTYSLNTEADLFVMDTKFRVSLTSKITKPEITKPIVQTVSQEMTKRPQISQSKMNTAKRALKKTAPEETTNSRQTAAANKIHTLEVPSGNNIKYSRLIPVKATAYTAAAEENGLWGAYDYFGNPLKLGTIAVDPDVIPMGSTVFITGYTFDGLPAKGMIAKATDMGSAVQGKRVDIFVPTSRADASKFGMQDVKVYILE